MLLFICDLVLVFENNVCVFLISDGDLMKSEYYLVILIFYFFDFWEVFFFYIESNEVSLEGISYIRFNKLIIIFDSNIE